VEIWESEQGGQNWFDHNIRPNLPPGVKPNQRYYPLHTAITGQAVTLGVPRRLASVVLERHQAGQRIMWPNVPTLT